MATSKPIRLTSPATRRSRTASVPSVKRSPRQATMSVEFAKKKVEVAYRFDIDRKTQTLLGQSLKLGSKEVKQGEPRVFVVDLTQRDVSYLSVQVELPAEVPDLGNEKKANGDVAIVQALSRHKKLTEEMKLCY